MKKHLKSIISLFAICAVIAMLLALTNYFTAPIIKDHEDAIANAALIEVLPGAKKFDPVSLPENTPDTVKEAYKADNGGYVFKLVTTGYGSDFVIMCGVTAEGKVSKSICLSSNETLGKEKDYGNSLVGHSFDTVDSVSIISGATKTTAAYRNAVKDALTAFNALNTESKNLKEVTDNEQ